MRVSSSATGLELPLVLDQDAMAELLGVSTRSIERMRRAGELPDTLIQTVRCPRWSRETVLAWLQGSTRRRARR